MNFIKLILSILGLVFGVMLILWALGFVWSIIWYLLLFGIVGAIGYGGYKLFRKIEDKALGSSPQSGLDAGGIDINMSWDEYERKYLKK
jgi:hypothetical protein